MDLLRGTNVIHWAQFLQYEQRPEAFGVAEAEALSSLGFDHVRIPIGEKHFWDDSHAQIPKTFDDFEALLDICRHAGLKAIIDLSGLRSHHRRDKSYPLFSDPACQDRFVAIWDELSQRFASRPTELVAYELLNEPICKPAQWNALVARVLPVIRNREPARAIVINSAPMASVGSVSEMDFPVDEHLILSFHYYMPYILTHHRICLDGFAGPIHYPGVVIREPELSTLPLKQREAFAPENFDWTAASHTERFQSPAKKARELGLPLYCGEFGCCANVPRDIRLRWHTDVVRALESCNIGWGSFAHNGLWQTVFNDRDVDLEIVKAMGVTK